jgi:hypothetical protein
MDLQALSWAELATVPGLTALLLALTWAARTWGGLSGRRATLIFTFTCGQVFGQMAMLVVRRAATWQGAADALLLGIGAGLLAVGAHQAQKAVRGV